MLAKAVTIIISFYFGISLLSNWINQNFGGEKIYNFLVFALRNTILHLLSLFQLYPLLKRQPFIVSYIAKKPHVEDNDTLTYYCWPYGIAYT